MRINILKAPCNYASVFQNLIDILHYNAVSENPKYILGCCLFDCGDFHVAYIFLRMVSIWIMFINIQIFNIEIYAIEGYILT